MRDSRRVALTPRGQRFLDDARQLLATAERMVQPQDAGVVRMAHIFERPRTRSVTTAEYPLVTAGSSRFGSAPERPLRTPVVHGRLLARNTGPGPDREESTCHSSPSRAG